MFEISSVAALGGAGSLLFARVCEDSVDVEWVVVCVQQRFLRTR